MALPVLAAPATAAFLASLVEVVEAVPIVLAVGLTRGWRPAAAGGLAAMAVLVVVVLSFGPLLGQIPIGPLKLAIGTLTLLFGLRILRAAGHIALHDEDAAFAHLTGRLRCAPKTAAAWAPGRRPFCRAVSRFWR